MAHVKLFEKQFQYKKPANMCWTLPAENLFGEFYQFGYLQDIKEHLNNVKSKLNNYGIEEWSAHTQRKNPAGEIPWFLKTAVKAEFVTVAWCKFFECLRRYPLVKGPKLNTLHLCEAPGAFISALNHHLHTTYPSDEIQWKWFATSLNPYYEGNQLGRMIADDRLMLHTLDHWIFYEDFTGDIMKAPNIEYMQTRLHSHPIDLITADGSIDCTITPAEQEEVVATLHFAEIVTALRILAEGGNFVVKKFTLFEAASVSLMYLLNCVFAEVHVCKPATSRRGNSEVYVVCLDYRPATTNLQAILARMMTELVEGTMAIPLFAKAELPPDFVAQHIECTKLFMNYQIQSIELNIVSFEHKADRNQTKRSHEMRMAVRQEFMQRYKVQKLPEEQKILHGCKDTLRNVFKYFVHNGSFAERESLKSDSLEAQVYLLQRRLNEMQKSLKSFIAIVLREEHPAQRVALNAHSGKPYESVNSSLFAALQCMLFCQKIIDTVGRHPLAEVQAECALADTVIHYEYTAATDSYYAKQQKFFFEIVSALMNDAELPDVISFRNYPFLTHFGVSILRYLQLSVYHEVSISTENDEFVVSLRSLQKRSTNDDISALHKLLATNEESAKPKCEEKAEMPPQNHRVLSVLSIEQLHCTEFSESLVEYNNLLLMKKFKDFLNGYYVN